MEKKYRVASLCRIKYYLVYLVIIDTFSISVLKYCGPKYIKCTLVLYSSPNLAFFASREMQNWGKNLKFWGKWEILNFF